jgi:hypothetical protein
VSRPLGLGPIPLEPPISSTRQVTVRQAMALTAGVFMAVVMIAFGAAVLADSGETLEGDRSTFFESFIFGLIVVPVLYGCERFFLRPRVRIDESGVTVHNPWRTAVLPWSSVAGASFERSFAVVLTGGDRLRSVLFGPTFSSPLTRRDRVDELVSLVNHEAARRAGRVHDPEAVYSAEALVGEISGEPAGEVLDADSQWTPVYGWVSLVIYAVAWTVACVIASA